MKSSALFLLLTGVALSAAPDVAKPTADNVAVKPKAKPVDPTMVEITDTPGLPRVLLIGDSISIGYTLPVRQLLQGKANVHRILTNGGPTKNASATNLTKWLGTERWDVIHFNFGLHDLKHMEDDKRQVSPEDYEKNLREIVAALKATGAKLIWANTTPVPEGKITPPRTPADVTLYNNVALKVMKDNGIAVDDLNSAIAPKLKEYQRPLDVHFNADGYKFLADEVAKAITAQLPAR
jgi:acyl-CoA thioesterase-1